MNVPDWIVDEFMQTARYASCDEMSVDKLCSLYDQLVLTRGSVSMPMGANADLWHTYQFLYSKLYLMMKGNNSTFNLSDNKKLALADFPNRPMAQLFEYAINCGKGIDK